MDNHYLFIDLWGGGGGVAWGKHDIILFGTVCGRGGGGGGRIFKH